MRPCPTEPLGEDEGDGPTEGSEAAADEDRLDSLEAPEAAEGEFSLRHAVPGCAVPGCAWPLGLRGSEARGGCPDCAWVLCHAEDTVVSVWLRCGLCMAEQVLQGGRVSLPPACHPLSLHRCGAEAEASKLSPW